MSTSAAVGTTLSQVACKYSTGTRMLASWLRTSTNSTSRARARRTVTEQLFMACRMRSAHEASASAPSNQLERRPMGAARTGAQRVSPCRGLKMGLGFCANVAHKTTPISPTGRAAAT